MSLGKIVDVKKKKGIYLKMNLRFMDEDKVKMVDERMMSLEIEDISVKV